MTQLQDHYANEQEKKMKTSIFFIEASSCEQFYIWKEYNEKVDWEQDLMGFSHIVGFIDPKKKEKPVNVCFSFAKINGQRICFYDTVSRFVDHNMVEEFILKHYPVKYNNNTRTAMTNATNVHNAIHEAKERAKTAKKTDQELKKKTNHF